jgi:carbamoyltransferase
MKILSINFGHDASLALFDKSILIDFLEIERKSRLKHHVGIKIEDIKEFLANNGLELDLIDFICSSCTQYWSIFTSSEIEIIYGYNLKHKKYFQDSVNLNTKNFEFSKNTGGATYEKQILLQNLIPHPSPSRINWNQIDPVLNLSSSHDTIKLNIDKFASTKIIQDNFFIPFIFKVEGLELPGIFVDHHAAHANYAAYYSNENALIATHDGGLNARPFNTGGIYLKDQNITLNPLFNHQLELGFIYEQISIYMGIDPGKLMGLSSYGRANKYILPIINQYTESIYFGRPLNPQYVVGLILQSSAIDHNLKKKYKNFDFNLKNLPLERAIQTASNVQYFVQKVYIQIISNFCEKVYEIDNSFKKCYTTGGFSLNCPTNTEINNTNYNIEYKALPAVGDTGLSIGAAVSFMKFINIEIKNDHPDFSMAAAFPPSNNIKQLLNTDKYLSEINIYSRINDESLKFLSNEITNGKIICTCFGRSEVGPRALGHRSIFAWAGLESNRDKINIKKRRENWRPLAPIVLKEDFYNYFLGDPNNSLFMLTVSKVINDKIPAVTHVDNTARVQIIDDSEYIISTLLKNIKNEGKVPVIINTSFNCAGEPLVENIEDAIKSFLNMQIDYLITDEYIIRNLKM